RPPFGVVADRDRDPFVLARAWVGVVRRHHVVPVGPLPAVASVHEVVHVPLGRFADYGLAHAGVEPLALAGAVAMAQRGEQVKNDRGADRIIGPGATGMTRRTARIALSVEGADERGRHRTPSDPIGWLGSGFAQQRDRNQDDVALDCAQFLVAEAEPAR